MLWEKLLRFWEVPDRAPQSSVDLIIVFTLPQAKDGSVSKILESLLQSAAQAYRQSGAGTKVAIENRFPAAGTILSEVARTRAVELGVSKDDLIRFEPPYTLEEIRNTWSEAVLAMHQCEGRRVLVIANHLHMRRALAATRRLAQGREVFWVSARDLHAYGSDAAQGRYRHPLFFFLYEICAYLYSMFRGWA